MWERSEKHLALGLLFVIVSQGLTGFAAIAAATIGGIHALVSAYWAFKE